LLVAVALLDELCQEELPLDLVESFATIGDLYEWYCTVVERRLADKRRGPASQGSTRNRHDAQSNLPVLPTSGPRCSIEPLGFASYEWLHRLLTSDSILGRWRDRGLVYRPEEWIDRLWAESVLQFIVKSNGREREIGLVTVYGHDPLARHARVAAIFDDERSTSGARIEGVVTAVGYAFLALDLNKVFAEVPEFNLPYFGSGIERYIHVEAHLHDYHWAAGRLWSMYVVSSDRAMFSKLWRRVMGSELWDWQSLARKGDRCRVGYRTYGG
jgi:hypothetical protein